MNEQPGDNRRTIVFLNRDVFFGVRLKQLGQELGYDVVIVPEAGGFLAAITGADVALGVIDINARPDWDVIATGAAPEQGVPILAFGPHLDVEGLRAAKAAGVRRVVSNGQFHRDAAVLIARYTGGTAPDPGDNEPDEFDNH